MPLPSERPLASRGRVHGDREVSQTGRQDWPRTCVRAWGGRAGRGRAQKGGRIVVSSSALRAGEQAGVGQRAAHERRRGGGTGRQRKRCANAPGRVDRDRVEEVAHGRAKLDGDREALEHLVRAGADDVDADDALVRAGADDLRGVGQRGSAGATTVAKALREAPTLYAVGSSADRSIILYGSAPKAVV